MRVVWGRAFDGKETGVTVAERFLSKFVNEPNTGCWLWTDRTPPTGYGKLRRQENP